MRHTANQIFTTMISIRLIVLFSVVTASCNSSTPQISDQTTPDFEPTASSGLVEDVSPSAPQFLPGQHLRFDTISLEQGLSQSTVFCML